MHTLEPELRTLRAEGLIDDGTAASAIALDRGEVFSLHHELRATLYAGVLLVMAGVGILLARNLDRIGPLTIVLMIALAAAACSVPAVRAKLAGRPLTVAGDYLLLLAVLLGSADLAYAERQFTLLGPWWSWHLLLLAVVHAAIAYRFASPLVLAASLTSLAGWFGVGGTLGDVLHVLRLDAVAWRACPRVRRDDCRLALRRSPHASGHVVSATCSITSRRTWRSGVRSRGASSGRGSRPGCRCWRRSPMRRFVADSTPAARRSSCTASCTRRSASVP